MRRGSLCSAIAAIVFCLSVSAASASMIFSGGGPGNGGGAGFTVEIQLFQKLKLPAESEFSKIIELEGDAALAQQFALLGDVKNGVGELWFEYLDAQQVVETARQEIGRGRLYGQVTLPVPPAELTLHIANTDDHKPLIIRSVSLMAGITTPDPATIGLLALGVAGLLLRRKRFEYR